MKTETNGAAAVLAAFWGVDRCVCCGEVVPEGRMVCPVCESGRWPGKG